jgi:predicted RecB family endonuclease
MRLKEAKNILENNGYLLKEYNYKVEVEGVPTNKVYIVVLDGGETDDDYAVFRDIIAAQKWGDNNCKYDYTVKTSKMF